MNFHFSIRRIGLLLLFMGTLVSSSHALEMTAGLLFNQMEARTEKVESLQADMVLISGPDIIRVTMSIQSPDKFTMDFVDKSIRVIFDGECLWIYLQSLGEVFIYDAASASGWFGDSLREYVNPKKVITNITRHTPFTFFDVELQAQPESLASSSKLFLAQTPGYCLRFTPLGSRYIQKLFDIGYYEMVFSKETYLPTKVIEYDPDGKVKGLIHVLEYRINETIPKEKFVFVLPPGVKQVPLMEVLKQKFEQSKDQLIEKVGESLEGMKEKLGNWGL